MKKITIEDIAKKAGVSKGTVSAVLNNKMTVKNATRNHVMRVIKKSHYIPKGYPRVPKEQHVEKSIGLIARAIDNPFYTAISLGINHYSSSRGYLLFVASSEGDHNYEQNISKIFSNKDIMGAIIAPVLNGTNEIDHLFNLKTANYPFVLLEEVPGIQANVVSIDNFNSTRNATRYLIDSGHKKIIHFSGPEYSSHTFERINGFRHSFSECNLVFNKNMIVTCGSHFRDGYKTAKSYFSSLSKNDRPTAVICFNDVVAFGLISALNDLSIKVPGDVSVIGHDDVEFAEHWAPPLTTISTPLEEMGQIAAEVLLNIIESPSQSVTTPVKKIIKSQLVIRESCRKMN